MTPPNIPFFYRLWHLYLEPMAALGGVYHLHFTPQHYFDFMPPTAQYNVSSQIVCDQLAAMYLLFAWIEAVLLRAVDDTRTWKYVIFGLLLCDAGHIFAAWQDAGTAWMLSPSRWNGNDVVTNLLNIIPFVTRIAFLAGLGFKDEAVHKKSQ